MPTDVRLRDGATLALVLLVTAALLSPLLRGGFLTDDYHAIRITTFGPTWDESLDPDDPTELLHFFVSPATREFQLYRPAVLLAYGLNYRLAGIDPFWYQVGNLLLHGLGGALLFVLARRLLPEAPSLALGAGCALFLWSPLELEVAAWTATRSDSLAWCFGATALILKLGRRERRVWPAVFATLALLSKESGLVWFPALVLVDLVPPVADGPVPLRERLRTTIRRAWPLAVPLAAYFAMRYHLFGSLFQTNAYAKKEFESFFSLSLWQRYGRSLRTLAMPISALAFGDSSLRWPLSIGSSIGFAGVVTAGLRALFGRPLGLAMSLFLLFWVPFLLAVTVNEIARDLIHTRAVYTPMAALGILVAAGLAGPFRRLGQIGSVIVLGIALGVSIPCQNLYVEAHRGVEAALTEIRAPLASLPGAGERRVAILDYQPLVYMRGAFHLEGAIQPALKRPFLARDFVVHLVAFDEADPTRQGWYTPFRSLLLGPTDDLVLLGMGAPDATTGVAPVRLLNAGAVAAPDDGGIALSEPAPGALLRLAPAEPATLSPTFAFATRALPPTTRYRFELYSALGQVLAFEIPPEALATEAVADGLAHRFTMPPIPVDIPVDILGDITGRKPYAWTIVALDEAGATRAAAGIRLLDVTVERP